MPHVRPIIRRAIAVVTLVTIAVGLAVPASGAELLRQRPLLTRSGELLHAPDPSVLHVVTGRDAGWYEFFGGGEHIRGTRAPAVAGRYGALRVMVSPQAWFSSAK